MQQLRSDIWAAAFVRRHNDLGNFCVVSRRGDAIAGQILIEIDHLDGSASLMMPVSSAVHGSDTAGRVFQRRLDRVPPLDVRARIEREAEFDPDIWVISIDSRDGEIGVDLI